MKVTQKKIWLGIVITLGILSSGVFYQIKLAKQALTAQLAKYPEFSYQAHHINYFPIPSLTLHQASYQKDKFGVKAPQIKVYLDKSSLLRFKPNVSEMTLANTVFLFDQQVVAEKLNIVLNQINLQDQQAQFAVDGHVKNQLVTANGALAKKDELIVVSNAILTFPIKQDNKQLNIEQILIHPIVDKLNMEFNQLVIEDVNFSSVNIMQAHDQIAVTALQDKARLSLSVIPQKQNYQLNFAAGDINIRPWLKLFEQSALLDGMLTVKGNLLVNQNELIDGSAVFNLQPAKLAGINLVDIISQYLPIRLGTQQYADKLDTDFEFIKGQLTIQHNQLAFSTIEAISSILGLYGTGTVDLNKKHCDFMWYLQANISGQQGPKLPVQLQGQCASPQYKIQIDKDFRHYLRDQLKGLFR